ncbi:MAG: UDP-2,4-diacetamido-2,4,6-trideoxy-beta-L-altropyranose hydrolase [Lachnospiraceae bacterium]|nr:UDP-2,4-diacetamido-2,4,6-trideoxy-beta-L-altropyranose hydrolase [Lachnospiraceae bacterium]
METSRLIYIRTDGNAKIASGHLVRCFSVALACQSLGMKICFLVSDGESCRLLKEISDMHTGFTFIQLKTAAFDHLDQELPEVTALLSTHTSRLSGTSYGPHSAFVKPLYLLDSYYVTEKYLSALRPLVKTAYMDDLQLFDYPVDLLINYDVIPDDKISSYQSTYQNAGQLLLGASYTPLRNQFQNRRISVRKSASDILITTGGSDPCHFCLNIIKLFTDTFILPSPVKDRDLKFHIVVGRMSLDKKELQLLANKFSFLELYENVSDMASLMSKCDLAVSAAGTTLYELCALGIPSISFTMADNQVDSASAFDAAGAIPCAGDIRTSSHQIFQEIFHFIAENSGSSDASYSKRKAAHDRMSSLVDGNGALRIAHALQNL